VKQQERWAVAGCKTKSTEEKIFVNVPCILLDNNRGKKIKK